MITVQLLKLLRTTHGIEIGMKRWKDSELCSVNGSRRMMRTSVGQIIGGVMWKN